MDSDSETEDGLIHKISSAFSHMFSSDSEGSEEEESSDDILEDDKKRTRVQQEGSLSSAEGQESQEEAEGVFKPPQLVPGNS